MLGNMIEIRLFSGHGPKLHMIFQTAFGFENVGKPRFHPRVNHLPSFPHQPSLPQRIHLGIHFLDKTRGDRSTATAIHMSHMRLSINGGTPSYHPF